MKNNTPIFLTGDTLSAQYRIQNLKKLKFVIQQNEKAIFDALGKDLGKHNFEAYTTEISIVYTEINHAVKKSEKMDANKKNWYSNC